MWLCSTLLVLIHDLGWTPLESTSNIMLMRIDNAAFGYDLTIANVKPTVNRQPMLPRRGPAELAESQHVHKKSEHEQQI